jgi:hypothetical protein
VVLLLSALAFVGSDWVGPVGLLKHLVVNAIALAVLALILRYIFRFNLLGYFLAVAGTILFSQASTLLQQPDNFFRLNAFAVFTVLLLLFAWPLLAWRTKSAQSLV